MKKHIFKHKKHPLSVIAISAALTIALATPVFACTGVYVGSDASDDGTIMIARSNDNQDIWGNYIKVNEHVDNEPGRTMPIDNGATVFTEIPATTYKYVETPWMDSTRSYNGLEYDAAACTNECGVVMTMAVTAFANDAAVEADPKPENGLTESTANDLVVCQSATAREAVEVLTGLIDKYGSSESNIALIADQQEAWYVEMYTGHQYAAVKLPSDMVAVFGNEFTLEYLSDYEDSIVSDELESLAKEKGFAVYGKNGELNLMKTYAEDTINYSHMRTWIGHQVLAPSVYLDDYDKDAYYPLTFYPDDKVSLEDVMELMKNRFEKTKYDPDTTGRDDMRVIGTDTAMSVHVIQVYPDLPTEMSNVLWECTGPDLYGVFVPVSIACSAVNSSYGLNQPASEFGNFDYNTYPWYATKELNTLCLYDYKVYGKPVQDYWNAAEKNMISGMSKVLQTAAENYETSPESASAYINNYCDGLQTKAFSDTKQLINDVMWYQSKNSNTMKTGRNPETHESTEKIKELDPITIQLDGSDYAVVPEYTQSNTGSQVTGTDLALIIAGIIVVCLVIVINIFEQRPKKKN